MAKPKVAEESNKVILKQKEYLIKLYIKDKTCLSSNTDELTLTLNLENNETALKDFLPVNLITPNNDGENDCFYFKNLPLDNCEYFFNEIKIYNQWGSCVFTGNVRDFQWCAEDVSDGMYFYLVDFNARKIKGWVQIIR